MCVATRALLAVAIVWPCPHSTQNWLLIQFGIARLLAFLLADHRLTDHSAWPSIVGVAIVSSQTLARQTSLFGSP